jgi:hypothetical protein
MKTHEQIQRELQRAWSRWAFVMLVGVAALLVLGICRIPMSAPVVAGFVLVVVGGAGSVRIATIGILAVYGDMRRTKEHARQIEERMARRREGGT